MQPSGPKSSVFRKKDIKLDKASGDQYNLINSKENGKMCDSDHYHQLSGESAPSGLPILTPQLI